MARFPARWQNPAMSSPPPPRFSRRTAWERHPNAVTEAWNRRLASGLPADDLTESNPTACGFRYPEERILRALADPRGLRHEPRPLGLPSARAAVAASCGADSPQRVILTASTSEAYAWLFKLLCERGDRVLIPRPSYPLFDFLAGLEEVEPKPYALRHDGRWRLDLEELAERIDRRTRAVVVVHPNNPTGNALTRDEASKLLAVCASRGIAVISDEVFLEYTEPETDRADAAAADTPARPSRPRADLLRAGSLAHEAPALTFSLGGLSKSAGLPQIKVGWMRLGGPDALVAEALARLEVIADTYLSVNTPAQWALPELLAAGVEVREQIRARVRANRAWLEENSRDTAWQTDPADGGWTAVLRVPRLHDEENWCVLLAEEEGVRLHPGFFFDFDEEGILVCSLLPPEDRFRAAMGRALRRMSEG